MSSARRAAALLAAALACATAAGAATVPWTAAGAHVRRLVTVEGVVARATTTAERRCILEFDPDDPRALRVVIRIPLITELPADPARLYAGKRVQVTGRVTRFQNRLEMLVTPAQVEVVGLAATPSHTAPPPAPAPPEASGQAPPTATPAPPSAATPPPAAAPQPAAARPPATTPQPATAPPTTAVPLTVVDPRCAGWRAERAAVREELRALTSRLADCLAAGRTGCADAGDRLGPPLSRLADLEQRLGVACP
ncbi:MAG TPA: hypothetical protein VNO26_01735 [Candidatus Limnocylindria bacterium]|nr:hypothetical protein [Candidatus Limnocylindria bacterium]